MRGSVEYRRCTKCSLLFCAPVKREGDRPFAYDEIYWEKEGAEALRREREDAFVRVLELIYVSSRPVKRILDFGCGYGETVKLLRNMLSIDAIGVDPYGVFEEREYLHRTDAGGLLARYGESSFDAIYSVEVFEHLEDPLSAIEVLAGLLKPEGKLLINTGTQEFIERDDPKLGYIDPFVRGHITIYSLDSLSALASRVGLEARQLAGRTFEVLFSDPAAAGNEHPRKENLATLSSLGGWFVHLFHEYMRLIYLPAEVEEKSAWALQLRAALSAGERLPTAE